MEKTGEKESTLALIHGDGKSIMKLMNFLKINILKEKNIIQKKIV